MLTAFALILADRQLLYLVGMVGAVFLVGVAAALKTQTFRLGYLANVVEQHLLPTMLAYVAVATLAWLSPDLAVLREAVFGLLMTRLVAELFQNLAEMGLQLPAVLTETVNRVLLAKSLSPIVLSESSGAIVIASQSAPAAPIRGPDTPLAKGGVTPPKQ